MRIARFGFMIIICSLMLVLCPLIPSKADDDSLKLNESSLSLNPGDSFELKICDESFDGLDEWLIEYNRPAFSSSDENVCTVDSNGLITAVGCGNCEIIVECTGMKASCRVYVKLSGALINKKSVNMYEGDSEYLWLSLAKTAVSRSFKITDSKDGKDASDCFNIKKQNSEGYSFTALKGGEYYIDLFAYDSEGKGYSGRCHVKVTASGLNSGEIAVAVDGTVELPLLRAQIESFTYLKDEDIGKEQRGSTKYSIFEASDGRKYCKISGIKPGTSVAEITYITDSGRKEKRKLFIRVTEPEVADFPEYLVCGKTFSPKITGLRKCSTVYGAVKDESLAKADNYSVNDTRFTALTPGAVKIAVVVDGKQFVGQIKCIDPKPSEDNVLLKIGKTKRIKILGIPDSINVKFKSSDKNVASVTKTGKIKSINKGTCTITADIGGITKVKIRVTVGKTYAAKAVLAAEKLLGLPYSQKLRMSAGYYDCSSFVWRVYKSVGYPLSEGDYAPVAADIAKILEGKWEIVANGFVNADLLKPGDLIFYVGESGNGRYKNICHVAMYYGPKQKKINGKYVNVGQIIHANSCVELSDYSGFRVNRVVLIVRAK